MIWWSIPPRSFQLRAQADFEKVALALLHPYGADWRDLCLKCNHPSKNTSRDSGAVRQNSKTTENAKTTPFAGGNSMWCLGGRIPFPANARLAIWNKVQKETSPLNKLRIQKWGLFRSSPFPHINNSDETSETSIPLPRKSLTAFAGQAEQHIKSPICFESIINLPGAIPVDNDIYLSVSKFITKMAVCSV